MGKDKDIVSCKCKYYGHISYPKIFSSGEKFPFNDIEKLKELGIYIMKFLKNTRKSVRSLNINIDPELINICSKNFDESIYSFRSNKHYNPWSCIVGNLKEKMIVIMTLTRNLKSELIVCCDVIKFNDKEKKIKKFFEIYKKFFIVNIENTNNSSQIYLHNLNGLSIDNQNYYEMTTRMNTLYEDFPIDEFNDGYMEVEPTNDSYYDNNNYMELPLIN